MTRTNEPLARTSLMSVLWDIQQKRRFISRDDMTKIASEFHISRMELEGVISFYHFYHRKHSGKYTIYLNNAIISKHKNYDQVKRAFEKELGISVGQVTDDKLFGLFETSCIGLSDQEVSALINFMPATELTPVKVKKLLDKLRQGTIPESLLKQPKMNIRYTPPIDKTIFFKKYTPGLALAKLKKSDPLTVIDSIKKSKLSGRGGAFFPTGMKLELCRKNKSDQKYLICNADEGEPGTFKDRVLMQKHPGLLLEGMILAAYAIGASKGYIYLRAEYFYLKDKIQATIDSFYQKGLLGKTSLNNGKFRFDVEIYMGAGAYVCGEETALISSMEGKRGEPSTKQYFPVEKGYLDKPTVVINVETLCAMPRIIEMGYDKFLQIGTDETPGTKLLSVSGDCEKPGIYEIEWGMKLRAFLTLIGAKDPHMVLFNGYSGECLTSADFDREISGENLLASHIQFDFKDPIAYSRKMSAVGLRSGGSFMVFDTSRDLMAILKNVTEFFVAESCGICVPCRTGNFLLDKKLHKIILGHGEQKDMEEIDEWSTVIKQSSRCGLGKTATNCLLTAILKFPDEFDRYLNADADINSAFDMSKAVQSYESIVKEIETSYG